MIAPFLAAVVAALPASGEPVRFDVSAAAQFDGRTIIAAHNADEGAWLAGGGSVGATLYSRRLVDDDAAPALQPFCSARGACTSTAAVMAARRATRSG